MTMKVCNAVAAAMILPVFLLCFFQLLRLLLLSLIIPHRIGLVVQFALLFSNCSGSLVCSA